MVNKVGLPQVALPTFLSFPHSHAFWDGGLGMVWDSKSSFHMEKPNGDEKEQAMIFHISTIGWLQGRVAHFLCCNPFFCKVVCIYMLLIWH
jgi:hypothetical protein